MRCKTYQLGGMELTYRTEEEGNTAMVLLPKGMSMVSDRRKWLDEKQIFDAWENGSLCHLALRHYPQGNGAGCTLKYGESTRRLRMKEQTVEETDEETRIVTELAAEDYSVIHIVTHVRGEKGLEVECVFQNNSDRVMTLDMITSFSLDNLSPLQREDGAYAYYLHRFRGGWSLEGKHQRDSIEQLNLGSTWARGFPESERYGSVGSFPVKRWFPFGCMEDREHGIFWAAQLAVNSSWQMELSRDGDNYSLSGGLGDCETAGWWKEVQPGKSFRTPKAYISVGRSLEEVCQNITGMFQKYTDRQPKRERELPIWFNEWCTSWGNPTHNSVVGLKKSLKGLPIQGIVVDAGWSAQPEGAEPQGGNGDWECDRTQFPQGLKAVSDELGKENLELGVWMEFEVTTEGAKIHGKEWDSMHLKRNGELLQTGHIRRYWDFRQPEVIEYLKEKVICFLKENNIRYLKVDYNGSIGMGCDGAESCGEGLRQQMEAVYGFLCMIRRELPELVIENCASGGHRLEPKMMSVTSVSSFSDAHECREIPYIAANLHYLILPRQSLIWAVVRQEMSEDEINYRMVSTLLGRMCLSGDMESLTDAQRDIVAAGCEFYQKCRDIIRDGYSLLARRCTDNPHHLKGYQYVIRKTEKELLLVFHAFAEAPEEVCVELPAGEWRVKNKLGTAIETVAESGEVKIKNIGEWTASAVLFDKVEKTAHK